MTSILPLQTFLFGLLINYGVFATSCPEDAILSFDGSTCYLYQRFPAQFVTAESLCRDSHGHLASINDLFVNDFVAQGGVEAFEVMQIDNFWIGANDLKKQDVWEWIDGSDFSFTNWELNEPVNDSRSYCAALSLPEGQWVSKSCYESKPYVCALPASSTHKSTPLRSSRHFNPTTTAARRKNSCNPEWSYLNSTGLCYRVVEDASDCYRFDTQEASIHSKTENNFIGELALKEAKNKKKDVVIRLSLAQYHPDKLVKHESQIKPWLSAREWGVHSSRRRQYFNNLDKKHKSSKKWKWFDGSSVDFQNWAKNEPKKMGEFTCAQLTGSYKDQKKGKFSWSTSNCIKSSYAVCSQRPNN